MRLDEGFPVDPRLHKRVVSKVQRCLDIAKRKLGVDMELPSISYTGSGVSAGSVGKHELIVGSTPEVLNNVSS